MPFDLPGKLQSKQNRPHLPGWDFCHAGKFVDLDRHRSLAAFGAALSSSWGTGTKGAAATTSARSSYPQGS
jgi:hypothetical protein